MTLTEQQVREILEACDGVSEGPFTLHPRASGMKDICAATGFPIISPSTADAPFFAALDPQTVSALCEELLSRRAADAAVRDAVLDIAAKIAEAVEMQQDIDHGSANSGGAEQAAEAIRALKSKASP